MQKSFFPMAHEAPGSGAALPLTALLDGWRQDEVMIVLLLAVVSLLLSNVPIVGWVFYPFRLLGTFIHELCHGLAAILTGGSFQRFAVQHDRTGIAWYRGGIRWIVTSAGYMGCAGVGGLLLLAAASDLNAGEVLFWLGLGLLLTLLFVRNIFGMLSGLGIAGALLYLGTQLSPEWAETLLLFLAVQVMLNAVQSLFDLVQISRMRVDLKTDAQLMREMTGIPAFIWAFLWTLVSIVLLVWLLTVAYGPRALTF
jgi:hypothetical protein